MVHSISLHATCGKKLPGIPSREPPLSLSYQSIHLSTTTGGGQKRGKIRSSILLEKMCYEATIASQKRLINRENYSSYHLHRPCIYLYDRLCAVKVFQSLRYLIILEIMIF